MAAKKSNWSSCNLLEPMPDGSRLWQFSVSSKKVKLSGDLRVAVGENPPTKAVSKDWTDLLSRKLNIATLPPEKVFLRVVDLPSCDQDELLPMVEFQIEDLSPLPAVQTVWSAELVPGSTGPEGNQTVLVIIAERSVVEERLEELESVNFLADRVEVPLLRELVSSEPRADGAHIQLVQGGDSVLALVAWWFDGRLVEINSFNLPDHDVNRDVLVEKINNVAWSGEIAGWMPGDPACYLAKRGDVGADWKVALAKCFGDRIKEVDPVAEVDMATATAEFASRSTSSGLMIEEYRIRNRQRFLDGLWMDGIKGVVAFMLLGLLGFYVYGSTLQGTLDEKQQLVTVKSNLYNKALLLKAKVETLEKQKALKFAALDAWYKVVTGLPAELKFKQLSFSSERTLEGKTSRTLLINGEVGLDNEAMIDTYHEALTRLEGGDGQLLFSSVRGGNSRRDARKNVTVWSLECEFDGK